MPMMDFGYEDMVDFDFGVCHADDLFILFRQDFLGPKNEIAKGADTVMINKMIGMWTAFAAKGDPGQDWPRLTKDKHEFAILNSKPIKMMEDKEFNKKVDFVMTMINLNEDYKGMDFQDHPAFKAAVNKQASALDDDNADDEEGEEEQEELYSQAKDEL